MERKLASIRKIDNISAIPDADAIEVATLGGWKVVVKKNEFKVNDFVVYFEIDSWIPTDLAPFLSKGQEPRSYNDVKGERLKTIRLRKQLSQGLVLPLSILVEGEYVQEEGFDVTEVLGIQKWEPYIPAILSGVAKGNFPSFLRKSDQERVQNIRKELEEQSGNEFEISIKLDGSSLTVFTNNGEYGVCSRNLELKETEENAFWKVTRQNKLIE